jgi:hypothetical protein
MRRTSISFCLTMEGTMPSYCVRFINEIPRNERLFHCCQRSIVIRSARSPERAVEAAKKRFARLEGIRDWKIHATLIEMEPIDTETKPQRATAIQRMIAT